MSYSFLDLAYDVLKQASQPLTFQQVWEAAAERGFEKKLGSTGKTPWNTLGAQLYVDVRDNDASKFVKVGSRPARFFPKERQSELPTDVASKIESQEIRAAEKKAGFHERDLHPLLTYFAYASPPFNRGKPIFTKTIHHEKAAKRGYSEWLYPDMVGFWFPLPEEDWVSEVIEFNRLSDHNSLRLFSFELKRSLTKGNYREAFFQAVSNSSWAHEGYLVAANILQDDAFLSEIERLAASFGIGIVHLDSQDFDAATVLYPARVRDSLDWETINRLCEQSDDFRKFLRDVRDDYELKRVHRAEYDEVIKDIKGYIAKTLKLG